MPYLDSHDEMVLETAIILKPYRRKSATENVSNIIIEVHRNFDVMGSEKDFFRNLIRKVLRRLRAEELTGSERDEIERHIASNARLGDCLTIPTTADESRLSEFEREFNKLLGEMKALMICAIRR